MTSIVAELPGVSSTLKEVNLNEGKTISKTHL